MSMSFGSSFEDTVSPGWGAPVQLDEEDIVTAAIKKEKVAKCVFSYPQLTSHMNWFILREIASQQENLRGEPS